VLSADPRIVKDELESIGNLSYNEARIAGMFGMKILDPIAIKEIVENGVDIPIIITNMRNPDKITTIERKSGGRNGHPLKIVTGKKNCAILRIESAAAQKLFHSLENDRRSSEFVLLSPFTQEETSRIIIVIEDSADDIEKAIRAVHAERSKIKFV